jgi:hypothetical protein
MVNGWIAHVKSYAKKHKVSYKEAMGKAKSTYKGGGKKQTKKDKKDESKGMKGQVKGTKSKSKKNFEDMGKGKKVKKDKKEKKVKKHEKGEKETVVLDGTKITFKKGGLHRSLKVPDDYTFKRGELNKLKKVEVGDDFKFKGKTIKMTGRVKKQITLGLNLMKK